MPIGSWRTLCLVGLVGLAAPIGAQTPAGNGFTYQGRLLDAGVPANGSYDLGFTLYDAPTGGAAVGTQTIPGVSVSMGLFTVTLDFGSSPFLGQARWLEIQVSPPGGPTLSPRQELTPSPYSLFSSRTDPANLTVLNASNLTSGTVPGPRLAGTYGQPLDLSSPANTLAGNGAEGRPAAYFDRPLAAIHAAAVAVRNLEKPVIAGLQGAVVGAGLNLALCCDYRVAADDVRLIQAFTNIGLVPDTGGTYLLPRLVGLARATELLFEGRTVEAKEAKELGLVNEVVPLAELDAAVERKAQRLAARPTRALGLTKRLLNAGAAQSFEAQLAAEQRLQQTLGADSADAIEGVRAVVGRREPRFEGR